MHFFYYIQLKTPVSRLFLKICSSEILQSGTKFLNLSNGTSNTSHLLRNPESCLVIFRPYIRSINMGKEKHALRRVFFSNFCHCTRLTRDCTARWSSGRVSDWDTISTGSIPSTGEIFCQYTYTGY